MTQQKMFANRPHTSCEDKFAIGDTGQLLRAVFVVLARYQQSGLQPGAEHWQSDTRWKRPQLIQDVRAEWLLIVGEDWLFPWHDDYVLYCWVGMRKMTTAEKRELCQWFEIEVPDKWK